MALIIKSGKTDKNKDKKQAYTWAACILVAVFLLSIVLPLLGSGKGGSSDDYKDRAFDLASLPFTNDAAESALLTSDKYQDVAKKDLISTLFSKKEKEERQASDAKKGTPPPDAEYQEVADKKARVEERKAYSEKRAAAKSTVTPTGVGSLRKGSSAIGGGGATSGVTANIWRADDTGRKNGSTGMDANKQQLLASIKGGRASGFFDAVTESGKAAKNKDIDAAAAGAASAFQKGAKFDEKDKVESELEQSAADLAIDPENLDKGLSENAIPGLDDAADKLDDKKKDNDREREQKCDGFLECFIMPLLGDIVKGYAKKVVGQWGDDQLENMKDKKLQKNCGSGSKKNYKWKLSNC